MSKKYTGNYATAATAKVFRQSERILCQTTEDGAIYVANGFLVFKMTPEEYAQIIQPVTCCEAGNWMIQDGEKKPSTSDICTRFFTASLEAVTEKDDLAGAPLKFHNPGGKTEFSPMYSKPGDFVAFYNAAYLSCIAPDFLFCRGRSPRDPAIFYADGGQAFAAILPCIRQDRNMERAARAYFVAPAAVDATRAELNDAEKTIDTLRQELAAKAQELEAATKLAESLTAQIQELSDEAATREAEEAARATVLALPAPTPATMAESIAARWSQIDGITATVKGSKTAAPIVWLSGSVAPYADAIKASGGRWASKKQAYYFRVA